MSTNLVGDTNNKRAAAQRPPLPKIEANFNAPVDAPPLDNPAVPPPRAADSYQPEPPPVQPSRAADSYQPEPETLPATGFDPFGPVDVSGLQSGTLPLVQTAGQTPLQVQEEILAPLEEAGIADLTQSEATRVEESAQEQDISILDYSPPDIDGQIQQGNERINSLIQQLDLQDRQRAAAAQDRYKGVSLQEAMQQLSREPEEGTLQRVFKQAGDYFGGAMFTDPRDGRQYTTPYVALTQRALGLPETQKEGPPNIAGALLYGLNVVGAAPIAYAKDKLDQVNRTVHDVTQMMPWLKGTQDAATRWMQRNAPVLAAQAIKKRDESLRNTAPGGSSNMTTMLRGGNYSFTQEASTGSIGKIPGTSIDVDPGSLVGFGLDVATGEFVEGLIKKSVNGVGRTVVRSSTSRTQGAIERQAAEALNRARRTSSSALSSRASHPPKQRTPAVKAATIPDHRAVVLRPSGRGTGKAVVPTNPARPVVVRTIQAVPDPVTPTRAHRSAPTPKYNQPKPTGAGGQFELPLTGVVQMPKVPSLLTEPSAAPVVVNSEQLALPGVLPERKQFGMLGVEFHPDNTVVFKGLDDMFEDNDVLDARAFFKDLAEQGQTPSVKLNADLDEFAWDNGFINAIHMGFKPVANDGTLFNPNLVEFGSDVTMQLTTPGRARRPKPVNERPRTNSLTAPVLDNARPREVFEEGDTLVERPEGVSNTVAGMLARTDSMVYATPSPSARALEEAVEAVDVPVDMSLRTLTGQLQHAQVEFAAGDAVSRYRLLRDAGVGQPNETHTRDFGRVRSVVTHLFGDSYDVSFKVDGSYLRADGLESVPTRDIADFSKFVIDLHKRNPSSKLTATIAAGESTEWLTKYKAYTRAGFVAVDELDVPIQFARTPDPGTAVSLLFDPDSITASALARRLQSTDSLIATPAADEAFVELANATQIRKVIDRLRVRAEETKKQAYKLTTQLPMGYRQSVDELPRLNIDTSVSFSGITARTASRNKVYHGTRVQTPDVAKLDHINGGSPSPIGIGLHVTENETHAKFHAMRSVNEDLPDAVQREYGAPSVSRYAIASDAYVLDASVEYTEVATLVREVLQEIYEPLVNDVPPQLSVKQAIEFVDEELNGEDALITLFQREFSDGLRAGGVDVVDAGPEARVVLNTEVLIDGTLNAPVRGVQDTAANATRYASYAFKLDDDALKTARSQRDNLEAAYSHAAQEVHEIKNILDEVDDRVHQAISETTLWDYNGVPDPDNIPQYKPDPEPALRSASTPFDTQTADISPCTL